MTRHNTLRTLICSGTVLLAIGCGDAGTTSGDIFPADTGAVPDTDTSVDSGMGPEIELRLACESVCETVRECRGGSVTSGCEDNCEAEYSVEASEECTAAGIELLNCLSGLSCGTSLIDPECTEARELVGAACPQLGLVVESIEETGREGLLEVVEDAGVDSEGTEESVDTEDDDSETGIVGDPIVVVEIPRPVDLIEFPWLVVSDDD